MMSHGSPPHVLKPILEHMQVACLLNDDTGVAECWYLRMVSCARSPPQRVARQDILETIERDASPCGAPKGAPLLTSPATRSVQSRPLDEPGLVPSAGLLERLMSFLGTCLRGLLIASLIVLAIWVVGTKAGVIPIKQGANASNPYLGLPPEKIVEHGRSLDRRLSQANDTDEKRVDNIAGAEQGEIEQTRIALRSINKAAPQYREAQRLLASYNKHEAENRRLMNAVVSKAISDDGVGNRKTYASQLEKNLSKAGMDAHVGVSGTQNLTLVVRCVLEGRLFVYQLLRLLNDTPLVEEARKLGFADIHFTNGRDFGGTYDVANNRWN